MTKQPTALRLADAIDYPDVLLGNEAAAELRRLHQSEKEGWRYAAELEQDRKRLHEMNVELLATLDKLARLGNGERYGNSTGNKIAQEAIAKATGEQQ